MKSSLIILSYIGWHYADAIRNIYGIFTNFIWFFYHFFSVPLLSKTLFAPWHKLGGKYKIDILLRLVGFAIRAVILIFALAIIAAIFLAGVVFLILWLLAPLILLSLFFASIRFLQFNL